MFRSLVLRLLLFGIIMQTFSHSKADEGMWLFNDLPMELAEGSDTDSLRQQEWADHLMKSCVRFNVGGSASFISSSGLVLTNHHVGSDTLYKLSTPERNIMDAGFLAQTPDQELKAPDLELNQLVGIKDVTAEVKGSVTDNMTTEQAVAARRAVIAKIEKSALDETGLKCTVTTLYGGGTISSVPVQEIYGRASGVGTGNGDRFLWW